MPTLILAALVLAILMVSGGITYSVVNLGDEFGTIVEPMTESAGGAIIVRRKRFRKDGKSRRGNR